MNYNKIDIDFEVYDSGNPKRLIVLDTSEWGHIKDKPAIIEVIPPGFDEPAVQYFDKCTANILNSLTLNLNCEGCTDEFQDIPDGLYEITVKGSPDKFNQTRHYLRTTATQIKLDELFLKVGLECFDKDEDVKRRIEELFKLQMLLKSAESNVRLDRNCEAQELLYRVQSKIDGYKPCKNCV